MYHYGGIRRRDFIGKGRDGGLFANIEQDLHSKTS